MTSNRNLKKMRLILILGFIPLLILCASIQIIYDNKVKHHHASNSIENTIDGIEREIHLRNHFMSIFINNNSALLESIIEDSENIHLLSDLLVSIREYFPDNFAVSIADKNGEIILDDFDGHIGDVCRIDLKKQLETEKYKARVHPNPVSYHYDISTSWLNKNNTYLLFASFKLDRIAAILKSHQSLGQKLFLVIKKFDYLIEVTEEGDRSKLKTDGNYKLTRVQIDNIIDEKDIHDSHWTVVVIEDEKYHSHRTGRVILSYLLIYIVYIIMIFVTVRNNDIDVTES